MRRPPVVPAASVARGEACMTWAEIGEALGYGTDERARKAVFMIYKHALKKLRNRPGTLERLRQMARLRAMARDEVRVHSSTLGGSRV